MSVPTEQEWLFWDVNSDAIELERDRRYVPDGSSFRKTSAAPWID